jgi:hypothetical protein
MSADWGSVYLAVCLIAGAGMGLVARMLRSGE